MMFSIQKPPIFSPRNDEFHLKPNNSLNLVRKHHSLIINKVREILKIIILKKLQWLIRDPLDIFLAKFM